MSTLLKLSGPNHEAMVKEAFIGAIARLGFKMAKRPLQMIGGYFNAKNVVSGVENMNRQAGVGRSLGNVASNTPGVSSI